MDRKTKKAVIRARNKRTQIINKHADQHEADRQAAREAEQERLQEQLAAARQHASETASDEPWTARTQMVRNRLTNKTRKSADRWNRFAGTAGSGGRGR